MTTKRVSTYTSPLRKTSGPPTALTLDEAALYLVRCYRVWTQAKIKSNPNLRGLRLTVDSKAPETLQELRECVSKGYLPVSPKHSETAIYGQLGNVIFRWFHDLGHVLAGLGMTFEEEVRLAELQLADISAILYGSGLPYQDRNFVLAAYLADTAAQSDYHNEHGEFPADQTVHVIQCLKDWGWFEEQS